MIRVNNEDINKFVEEMKKAVVEEEIPDNVAIVYKDAVACCRYFPIGIVVEIEGLKTVSFSRLRFYK